jgi:hypothetical protein
VCGDKIPEKGIIVNLYIICFAPKIRIIAETKDGIKAENN